MSLILSIAAYVAVIPLIWGVSGRLRAPSLPIASLPYVGQLILVGNRTGWAAGWLRDHRLDPVPRVTIGLSTDTFALLLTAVVAGIGLLIVVYSAGYFADALRRDRVSLPRCRCSAPGWSVSSHLTNSSVCCVLGDHHSGPYLPIGFDDEKADARASRSRRFS